MTDTENTSRPTGATVVAREFLTPGMAIAIPLILGSAVLVVAILASHRLVSHQREEDARQRLEEARGLLRESLDQMKNGNYTAAEHAANAAVDLVPDLAIAYIFRAESRTHLNRLQEAVADYTRSLDLEVDPMDVYNACYGRGVAHAQLGLHEEAVKDFSRALELQPHRAEGYISRAASRKRLGDAEGSEQDLQRARELGRLDTE